MDAKDQLINELIEALENELNFDGQTPYSSTQNLLEKLKLLGYPKPQILSVEENIFLMRGPEEEGID